MILQIITVPSPEHAPGMVPFPQISKAGVCAIERWGVQLRPLYQKRVVCVTDCSPPARGVGLGLRRILYLKGAGFFPSTSVWCRTTKPPRGLCGNYASRLGLCAVVTWWLSLQRQYCTR